MTRANVKAMASRIFWTIILKELPKAWDIICVAFDKAIAFLEASIPMLIFLVIYVGNKAWNFAKAFAPVIIQMAIKAPRKAQNAVCVFRGYFIQCIGVMHAVALYGAKMGLYVALMMLGIAKSVKRACGNVTEAIIRELKHGWEIRKEIIAEQKDE